MGVTQQLVSVEEYMHSSYEPDAEYVGGRIVPRAMPKKPHSRMQRYLVRTLDELGPSLGYEVWPEQRILTQADPPRYRVPDLCLTRGEPDEDVFTDPPFLCVEILSPDDSAVDLRAKVHEYLAFGVAYIWVVDPRTWWLDTLVRLAATPLALRPEHVSEVCGLQPIHKDQFDRMLIAQAVAEHLT
jgi:Uma2 family endonuclease